MSLDRFELSTFRLSSEHSTTELQGISGKIGLEPIFTVLETDTLPLSYSKFRFPDELT